MVGQLLGGLQDGLLEGYQRRFSVYGGLRRWYTVPISVTSNCSHVAWQRWLLKYPSAP